MLCLCFVTYDGVNSEYHKLEFMVKSRNEDGLCDI